jgi:hypothetical protein
MASDFGGHEPWFAPPKDERHESSPNLNLTQLVEHEEPIGRKMHLSTRVWTHHQTMALEVGCQCTLSCFGVRNQTYYGWWAKDFVWKHLLKGWCHYFNVVCRT